MKKLFLQSLILFFALFCFAACNKEKTIYPVNKVEIQDADGNLLTGQKTYTAGESVKFTAVFKNVKGEKKWVKFPENISWTCTNTSWLSTDSGYTTTLNIPADTPDYTTDFIKVQYQEFSAKVSLAYKPGTEEPQPIVGVEIQDADGQVLLWGHTYTYNAGASVKFIAVFKGADGKPKQVEQPGNIHWTCRDTSWLSSTTGYETILNIPSGNPPYNMDFIKVDYGDFTMNISLAYLSSI